MKCRRRTENLGLSSKLKGMAFKRIFMSANEA